MAPINHKKKMRPRKPTRPHRPNKVTSYTLPKAITRILPPDYQTADLTSAQGKQNQDQDIQASKIVNKKYEPITILSRCVVLLDLVHTRHKNQHRNQQFFKWVNLLRKACGRLRDLHVEHVQLDTNPRNQQPKTTPKQKDTKSDTNSPAVGTAEQLRRKLERQAELRSHREVQEDHIRETMVPQAYVSFTGLIADKQFANLGVMLVGLLSDVTTIVKGPRRIEIEEGKIVGSWSGNDKEKHNARGKGKLLGRSEIMTGPDTGEVVERMYDSADGIEVSRDNEEVVQRTDDTGVPMARGAVATKMEEGATDTKSRNARDEQIGSTLSKHSPHALTSRPISETSSRSMEKQDQELGSTVDIKTEAAVPQTGDARQKKDKRKKKKKGNAIDDLFSGFG